MGDEWSEWRTLPSTVTPADIDELEVELGLRFPAGFRSYLGALHHLYDQVHARSHRDHLVLWIALPSDDVFGPLRMLVAGWAELLPWGLLPFAHWGDLHGPMC